MKQKISTIQIIRSVLQLFCFLFLPGLFIDSFNGIKVLVLDISGGSVSAASLLPALFPTVLLIIATMIFGRFFCGFMCAFGTLGDAIHFIGRRLFKINYRVPESADKKLKWLKYVLLVGIIFTWILGISVIDSWSPWVAFGSLLSLPPDFAYAFSSITIGSILLLLIIIASLFVERFFCRYFCPMGAIFSLASKLRIAKIRKTRTNCGRCKICTNQCKMGIPLYESDVVSSGECIGCMKCLSPCPRSNVKFTVAAQDAAPLMASVAAASVIGMYYIGNIGASAFEAPTVKTATVENMTESSVLNQDATADNSSIVSPSPNVSSNSTSQIQETQEPAGSATQTDENTAEAAQISQQNESGYADGTYEGSGTGFRNGTTTVSIIIKNGQIADIETVSTRDDGKYYNRAFSTITSEIISSQSTSVSVVSGATFSSRGIMSAVADALTKAKV